MDQSRRIEAMKAWTDDSEFSRISAAAKMDATVDVYVLRFTVVMTLLLHAEAPGQQFWVTVQDETHMGTNTAFTLHVLNQMIA